MKRSRRRERGFALMLVFLMAALVAIALYRELPRVAFEAQRSKEELLIERGEQYKRAIQIFVRQNNGRYPQKIEDLENFNNRRYLRRRYKDPMTGSDEWRLVHIGPGGVLTDSLTQKPPQSEKGKFGTSVEDIAREQQEQTTGTPSVTPRWGLRRASESGIRPAMQQPVEGEDSETPPGDAPAQPQEGENPAQYAGQTPVPGQPVPGQAAVLPGQPGWQRAIVPGQTVLPGQPGWQPAQIGATPGLPGQTPPQMAPPGSQVPGAVQIGSPQQQQGQYPYPQQPYPAQPQSPFQPQSPVRLQPVPVQIQNQISNPQGGFTTSSGPTVGGMTVGGPLQGITGRPFGGSATTTAGSTQGSGSSSPFTFGRNTMGGGGIAGVASKAEEEGIKLYNDRSKYNEWEFIYDPRRDRTNPMSALGATGIPGQTGAGQTGTNQTGTNTSGQNPIFTPIGSNPPVQNPGAGPRSR